MSYPSHKRLVSACCGMELCWLCAWANFLGGSTTQISFPLAVFCMTFFMALCVSYFFMARQLRRIWRVLGHVLGPGFMVSVCVFVVGEWQVPNTFFQWYQISLIATMVCLFWYKGAKLSFRQRSYKTTCNYFDLGISLFFALGMIKLLIQLKGGILIPESFTLYTMAGYFFFGLSAVFLSQNPLRRKKVYLKGFRVYGVLVSGAIVLLACGMGLVFVLLPGMTAFAESGYRVLKQTAGPLSPYLIAILRFVFSLRNPGGSPGLFRQNSTFSRSDTQVLAGQTNWADGFFFYGVFGIFFLICAGIIGYLVYKIFKFLMSKQGSAPADREEIPLFFRWIRWLVLFFNALKAAILAVNRKDEDAGKGFIRLESWGRKSGMPKLYTETPAEYAKRLEHQFVPLENEIAAIVHAFHLETYGELHLGQAKISEMAGALKTLHSPLFWPLRIKSIWRML